MIPALNYNRRYVYPMSKTARGHNETPPAPKPYCHNCRSVGVLRYSDPVNCGVAVRHPLGSSAISSP